MPADFRFYCFTFFILWLMECTCVRSVLGGLQNNTRHSVPRYLSDFCTPVANVAARSQLRSARRHLVVVPRYSRSTYGRRAFSVAGPMTWNSLADSLRDPSLSMIDSFRRQLKTFLFYNNRPCVFSALEIFLLMRYISRRFTYLLTYSWWWRWCWLIQLGWITIAGWYCFQNTPFLKANRSALGLKFVGFIPDFLERLSLMVGFDYEITPVRDGRYGSRLPDGQWNGMIGELTRGVRYVFYNYFVNSSFDLLLFYDLGLLRLLILYHCV